MSDPSRPLDALEATIRSRAEQLAADPAEADSSYTCRLLAKGLSKIAEKLQEETSELIEAAGESGDEGRSHFVYEAGDVIYHLLVMLRAKGVDIAEIESELARRFGVSGLEEKASRNPNN